MRNAGPAPARRRTYGVVSAGKGLPQAHTRFPFRRPRLLFVHAAVALTLIAAAASQLPAQEGEGAAGDARQVAVLVSGPVRRQTLPFLPPNTIEYQRGVYELPAASASEAPTPAAPAASPPAAPEVPAPASGAPASSAPGGAVRGASVEVFYTEAPVFRRGTWTEASCGGRPVHVLPEAGGTLVHYAWPQEQRHAFFRFGAASDAAAPGTARGATGSAGAGTATQAPPADGAAVDANQAPPAGAAPGNAGAASDAAAAPANAGAAPGAAGAPDAAAAPAGSECDFIEAFLERFFFFLETTDSSGVAPFPAVVPR